MAKLLVKEFVDCARALGEACQSDKDYFSSFLKEAGYESLNDYKARATEEKQAENFKHWTQQLIDSDGNSGSFTWAAGSGDIVDDFGKEEATPNRFPTTQIEDALADDDDADDEGEEVTIGEMADDVATSTHAGDKGKMVFAEREKIEKMDRLLEVLGSINVSNAIDGGDKAINGRLDELDVVIRSVEAMTRSNTSRIEDHFEDEKLHQGGTVPSFTIQVNPAEEKFEGEQPLHYKFPLVAASVSNRIPTMIVGPAGWGKTSTIKALADTCRIAWGDDDVEYIIQSIGPQTSKADILGYMDANGKYVRSQFRMCFENGFIYACDEADAGSAGSLTLLNQGFANQECSFPDNGMIDRHENFVPLFLANTYGQGANATYVGRNQLDAATLDRFAVVEYDYDETWEGKICGVDREGSQLKMDAGGKRTKEEWVDYVCRVRGAVDSLAVRHVVSPRASINGIKLLEAGLGFTHVSNMCVWKGMDSATRAKITNEMDNN